MSKNSKSSWDNYAEAFSVITTHFQASVYNDIARQLYGKVVDFGAGSAKLLPYLEDNKSIKSYTGVDASVVMVEMGGELVKRLGLGNSEMVHSSIESFSKNNYDSAVSINSYYVWDDPKSVLHKIYSSLSFGGEFFLVTPNQNLDMPRLLKSAKKEHVMNPAYKYFVESNTNFDKNMHKRFVSINHIVEQCHEVGFELISCHNDYYLGGVNYIRLQKP